MHRTRHVLPWTFARARPFRIVPESRAHRGSRVRSPSGFPAVSCSAPPCVPAAAVLSPIAAGAQVVRGTVVDEASGRGLPGIVVVLLDSTGKRLAGVLADDDGRYAIRITAAGPLSPCGPNESGFAPMRRRR